jgi:hypothetical protein
VFWRMMGTKLSSAIRKKKSRRYGQQAPYRLATDSAPHMLFSLSNGMERCEPYDHGPSWAIGKPVPAVMEQGLQDDTHD